MKKFLSLLLVLVLGYLMISYINNEDAFVNFVDLEERVSSRYINKGSDTEVLFGEDGYETGSANMVTSIVANYRSFDTLGEVTVLFVSALGVALLIGANTSRRIKLNYQPNFMLKIGSKALFGIILMTGVFMAVHGHLTPGGGFPGGAMIASAFLLLYMADDHFRAKIANFKLVESLAGIAYVGIGIAGLFLTGNYFLKNFMDAGTIGDLFSAGIVPIVYVIIGLKVGSELSSILDHFLTEEGV